MNKQLLSNMLDHEATQVPYTTRITFLTDSYVFAQTTQPFFALVLWLAILLYEGSTFEQQLKVASYIDF